MSMMDIKALSSGFGNWVVRRYTGSFWLKRNWLKKTEFFSQGQLDQLQTKLVLDLVKHCSKAIPYYRNLIDQNGIIIEDIQSADDLKQFPILTKQNVMDAGDLMISRLRPKCLLRHAHTGGTTGTPMNIYRSPWSIGIEHAFVRRQWDWARIKLTDRCAYLTGRIIARPDGHDKLYQYDPFMKELILSTYHLNENNARDYIGHIERYQCVAIVGYPSAIHFLAQIYKDYSPKNLKIRSVLTSSETISDSARKTIQEAFGCSVYDYYGSAERVCYIFTCEKGNYHILPEYGYTELIPIESGSNVCRVISTGFWNYAMPFIRYDLGDTVVKSDKKCECGRHFQCIERIEGRSGDVIRTPSGREFGAAILTHLLYGTNNIVESQIIQDHIDQIQIDYVPNKYFCENDMNAFIGLIEKHLPIHELKVKFNKVDMVERTVSGKLRPVVSRI